MRIQVLALAAACWSGSVAAGAAGHTTPLPEAPPGTVRLLLEAEPRVADAAAADLPTYYGEVAGHDADRVSVHDRILVLAKAGHAQATAALRWALDDRAAPGEYEVWTCFTLGGVEAQTFSLSAGPGPANLDFRSRFRQSNGVSWQMAWRRASAPLTLYPGDRCLEVTLSGRASQQKNLDAFLLVRRRDLPAGMTPEGWHLRSAAGALRHPDPAVRLYVLEGGDAAGADRFLRELMSEKARPLRERLEVTLLWGDPAAAVAGRVNIPRLPALVAMDARYAVLGLLSVLLGGEDVVGFLERAVERAGGPVPGRPAAATETPQPLRAGVPVSWLVAETWAGPAGLSLWGIDAEANTRPAPGDPCPTLRFDAAGMTEWQPQPAEEGVVVLSPSTHDCVWPRGTGYAHLYLRADRRRDVWLRLKQTGIRTAVWLDGRALPLEADPAPPAAFAKLTARRPAGAAAGTTDQGASMAVALSSPEGPRRCRLSLAPGWHRLLVKLVMQHQAGEVFAFAAQITDADGRAATGIETRLFDPEAALDFRADAARLAPVVTADAPANLPHPGQPLKLRVEFRPAYPARAGDVTLPLLPFDATLRLRVTDYDGREVATKEAAGRFPGSVTLDLGSAPETGYYAVHPSLHTPEGRLIRAYPPDGFSVIRGTAAQRERQARKKVAVVYYFMGESDTYLTTYLPWMARTGILRNIGSHNAFHAGLWEKAREAGVTLTADFWDFWSVETRESKETLAHQVAPYTRWFKSMNEIDIQKQKPAPERWVERTRWEYDAAKSARTDAFYVGGSLVRTGVDDWFTECLRLGLDRYHDAWDVHAYPQRPPVLEGTLSNSPNETERGVLECYRRLGRTNTKPFWIGETGARACHGDDARRWQAATVAKMVACALSHADWQVIGFLIPWQYSRARDGGLGSIGDIEAGHMPAEAAYYTVSALIDGFPYTRLSLGEGVQAARFGPTTMLWSTAGARDVPIPLEGAGPWVVVDVVGRVRPLAGANTPLQVTDSPVYVLTRADYGRLTRLSPADTRERQRP